MLRFLFLCILFVKSTANWYPGAPLSLHFAPSDFSSRCCHWPRSSVPGISGSNVCQEQLTGCCVLLQEAHGVYSCLWYVWRLWKSVPRNSILGVTSTHIWGKSTALPMLPRVSQSGVATLLLFLGNFRGRSPTIACPAHGSWHEAVSSVRCSALPLEDWQ